MNAIEQSEYKEIAQWLNKRPRDYYRGAQLFRAYHPKNAMAHSLQIYPNMDRLEKELSKRYNELRALRSQETPIKAQNDQSVITYTPKAKEELKEEIRKPAITEQASTTPAIAKSKKSEDLKRAQQLREDVKQLFKNRGAWHRQMCLIGESRFRLSTKEKAERSQLAKQVVNATSEIDRIFNLLDFFELNGYFPEETEKPAAKPSAPITDEVAKKRLNNSLMPNISKLQKKIKEEHDQSQAIVLKKDKQKSQAKIAKWTEQLQVLEAERDEIRQKLKPKKK